MWQDGPPSSVRSFSGKEERDMKLAREHVLVGVLMALAASGIGCKSKTEASTEAAATAATTVAATAAPPDVAATATATAAATEEPVAEAPAPPAEKDEQPVGKPASADHYWAKGHWNWSGREYIWVPGHWAVRVA